MATKASVKNIPTDAAYAPPVPASTAAIRNPLEPLTVYPDGTIILPKQLTHDNIAREVKLVNLVKDLQPDFEGVETEDNWGRRETNIIVLRKLTNSEFPNERTSQYIAIFRGLLDGIIKSATTLRTSLSLHGTTLIQEAAKAVGPGLDNVFDILYRALEKQALTKPAQAQAANNAMIAVITNLSFHKSTMDQITESMNSKNKALRGYAIGWLDALIQHVAKNTLESNAENIEKILRKGLSDADGVVREKSRGVFWNFSSKFKTRADLIYESLPKQTQKSLDAAQNQGVLNSKSYDSSLNRGPPPPRPATSHADRSSLKQFIKDKKKEAKKVDSSERPKSVAATHERHQTDLSSTSTHNIRRAPRAPPSRPESAASIASIDRRHAKQPSQDMKKPRRGEIDDDLTTESTRTTTMTPHAYKKPVRRPIERPDSVNDRNTSSVVPSKPVRPGSKAVPTRPKTASSVSSGTGALSSAPKRPNFPTRKIVTSASTTSVKPALDSPIDLTDDLPHETVPAHIAHVVTPPRAVQNPMPLQELPIPQMNGVVKDAQSTIKGGAIKQLKDDAPKQQPRPACFGDDGTENIKIKSHFQDFTHGKEIDPLSITAGRVTVLTALISDPRDKVPEDSFDILSTALRRHDDVSVRRAAMDLGLALWKRVDDAMVFWSQLEGLPKRSKDFLIYWISKDQARG